MSFPEGQLQDICYKIRNIHCKSYTFTLNCYNCAALNVSLTKKYLSSVHERSLRSNTRHGL